MSNVFDWIKSINNKTQNLLEVEDIKSYTPYIANKALSHYLDTVLFVNEMNIRPNIDKDQQYTFLYNTIRKGNRYSPWEKKNVDNDLKFIKKYYNCNNEKAYQALKLLSKEQIAYIRNKLENFELEDK